MSRNSTSVSLIMASFNKASTIEQALASVRQQSNDIEIIVVDDCSTDSTDKLLKILQPKYKFHLISNETNLGPSTTRNKGLRAAKGDLISFLDADDYWLPLRLEKTMKAYFKNPESVFYSDAYYQYGDMPSSEKQSSVMPPHEGAVLDELFRRNFINLCSVLMPRNLALKIKFDEKLRSAEDYDFWIRLAAIDCTFKFIDEPLVVYRKSPNNLTADRLSSIEWTWFVLEKNKNLAKTSQARHNLKFHKINLLEERLLVSHEPQDLRNTLEELKTLRTLGKREKVVYGSLSISHRLGRAAKKRLLR